MTFGKRNTRVVLETDLHRRSLKLVAPTLDGIVSRYQEHRLELAGDDEETGTVFHLVLTIGRSIDETVSQIDDLHRLYLDFSARISRALSVSEIRKHLLDFAKDLGANRWRLLGDRMAFRRWHGQDAMTDRYLDTVGHLEQTVSVMLERMGAMAAMALKDAGDGNKATALWRHMELEGRILPLLSYDGDPRINTAAFQCLTKAIDALPSDERVNSLTEGTLRVVYRAALDSTQDIWVQRASITALQNLSPSNFTSVITTRLQSPGEGDDLFVRRRAVELLGENLGRLPQLARVLDTVADDPSPHVRQALAAAAVEAPIDTALPIIHRLCMQDPENSVRASALVCLTEVLHRAEWVKPVRDLLAEVLQEDQDPFVLRTAFLVSVTGAGLVSAKSEWVAALVPPIENLHVGATSLSVRRWAAETRERLWCAADPEGFELWFELSALVKTLPPGRSRRLPTGFMKTYEGDKVGRVLAVLAQNDFGFEVRSGLFGSNLYRGDKFRGRLWRLLHEMRSPASDKRQAFNHGIGRVYSGNILAPPSGLGELSQTKVCGEPYVIPEETSWRPYLPLPDHLLSAIDTGGRTRIFTSDGITEITAPRGLIRRIAARVTVTFQFPRLSQLRNWREHNESPPSEYLGSLAKLGVHTRLEPHCDTMGRHASVDPKATRFFPL